MVSGLTALGAGDSHGDRAKWSYLLLADELRSEREFDQLRPLYLDLILFFDRIEQSAAAALLREEVSIAGAVLTSLREELGDAPQVVATGGGA